jgi:hypothetical protein
VGGIVAGVVGLICLALLAFFLLRRRSGQRKVAQAGFVQEMPEEQQQQQQQQKYYEMESPPVEMPAENQDASKPKLNPSYAPQELDSSGDQNVR